MKLTKKQKRAVRQSVYKLIVAQLRGQAGQDIALMVYNQCPDETPALTAVNVREYALHVVQSAADGYISLIGSLDLASEVLPDKDAPVAHSPDTGHDA